jgi:hypothetical protein
MNYLKLFEEFTPKEIVTVNGEIGQVISETEDGIVVRFFKPKRTKVVSRDMVKPQVKCLSQCDRRVVGDEDDRYVKCFSCGKEQRFGR